MDWSPTKSTCIVQIHSDREQVTYVCLCPNKREPKLSTVQKNNDQNVKLSIYMFVHHVVTKWSYIYTQVREYEIT